MFFAERHRRFRCVMLTAEHREREGPAEGTEGGGGAIHEAHQGSSFHSGSAAVCTRPGFRPRSRRLRWAASEYRSRELAVHLEERGPRLLPLRRRTLVDRGKEHGRSVPISAALYIVPSAFGPSSPSPIVTAGSASRTGFMDVLVPQRTFALPPIFSHYVSRRLRHPKIENSSFFHFYF